MMTRVEALAEEDYEFTDSIGVESIRQYELYAQHINKIYDELEGRTCSTCVVSDSCDIQDALEVGRYEGVPINFCCVRWKEI